MRRKKTKKRREKKKMDFARLFPPKSELPPLLSLPVQRDRYWRMGFTRLLAELLPRWKRGRFVYPLVCFLEEGGSSIPHQKFSFFGGRLPPFPRWWQVQNGESKRKNDFCWTQNEISRFCADLDFRSVIFSASSPPSLHLHFFTSTSFFTISSST